MRITEQIAHNTFLNQIHTNRSGMVKYNNQVSSGKRVTKASDDSVSYLSGKLVEEHIRKNEQYRINVDNGLFQARATQDALDGMHNILTDIKTLVLQGANDSINPDDRALIATQIESRKEELIQLGNTDFNGIHLFAGTNSDEKPFYHDVMEPGNTGSYGTDTPLKVLSGQGVTIETTVTSRDLRDTANGDLFGVLQDAIDALNSNDNTGIQTAVENTGAVIDHVAALATRVANNINRLDYTTERLENRLIGEKDELGRLTDADVVEAMLNFQNAQSSYEAVLGIQAQMMQMSILNFLR